MSITLFIQNDTDKSIVEDYPCLCVEMSYDGVADPDCHQCQGEGNHHFESSKWALNMSNSNFLMVMKYLGYAALEYSGTFEPKILIGRVNCFLNSKGNHQSSPYSIEKARRIKEIAEHAQEMGELVCWG